MALGDEPNSGGRNVTGKARFRRLDDRLAIEENESPPVGAPVRRY